MLEGTVQAQARARWGVLPVNVSIPLVDVEAWPEGSITLIPARDVVPGSIITSKLSVDTFFVAWNTCAPPSTDHNHPQFGLISNAGNLIFWSPYYADYEVAVVVSGE